MSKRVTHTFTCIDIYIYIRMHVSNRPLRAAVPTPKAPRKRAPARVRTRAHIGGAAARNGPRSPEAPAERVRHSARRRVGSGAYQVQRGDGRGVPRADVRVESRRRAERLCAEAARGRRPTRKGSQGLELRDSGRARSTSPPTRAHTADPSPSRTGARTHNPDRFSDIHING